MSDVKDRPLLFQGDMVNAVLDDLKTETRRIIKPVNGVQPINNKNFGLHCCPYGKEGDHLWVKETFYYDNKEYVQTYIDEPWRGIPDRITADTYYRASEEAPDIFPKWTPSIYMPRWASRIELIIRMIDIERIQMISLCEIEAEGLRSANSNPLKRDAELRDIWIDLWNGINRKPRPIKNKGEIISYQSFPWSEDDRDPRTVINGKPHYCFPNPYVWVIKFRRTI